MKCREKLGGGWTHCAKAGFKNLRANFNHETVKIADTCDENKTDKYLFGFNSLHEKALNARFHWQGQIRPPLPKSGNQALQSV
jgi:hypothetical protein